MRRVPGPGGHGRPKTRRVSSMFPSRSQPDMTLVGVRSVLSPRPYSAPQAALPTRGPTTGLGHAGRAPGNSISEVEDLTDQSDVAYSYAGQSNVSSGSLCQSRDSENNTVDQPRDENESLAEGATDLVEDDTAAAAGDDPASCRLVTQASRDSALGSSTDGINRDLPGDHHVQTPPLDSPRELLQNQEETQESSDSEDETSRRSSPETGSLNDDQDSDVDAEEGDEETQESRTSLVKPEAEETPAGAAQNGGPARAAATPTRRSLDLQVTRGSPDHQVTRGSPDHQVTRRSPDHQVTRRSPDHQVTRGSPDHQVTRRSPDHQVTRGSPDLQVTRGSPDHQVARGSPDHQVTSYCSVLDQEAAPGTPALQTPTIVTSDLSGRRQQGSGVNLQEVIDLRLAEAQRSGHLDLANLGLPFFPSAVLLADGSMIHRLSLQDNRLVELAGSSLTQLTSLTWLDLRYNLLQCLPREVAALTHLQVLLLQSNNLTALPATLGTLPELATLQVSDNPLSFPPADVIKGGTRAILQFLKGQCQAGRQGQCQAGHQGQGQCQAGHQGQGHSQCQAGHQGHSQYQTGHQGQSHSLPCCSSRRGAHPEGNQDMRESLESWIRGESLEDEPCGGAGGLRCGSVVECGDCGSVVSAGEYSDSDEEYSDYWHHSAGGGQEGSEEVTGTAPSPSPSLRIAIRSGEPPEGRGPSLELPQGRGPGLGLPQGWGPGLELPQGQGPGLGPPDTGRDSLGRPQSPSSACLLTPCTEIPARPEYDLTREDDLDDPCRPEDECRTWRCQCFRSSSAISWEKLQVINQIPDAAVKHRLLGTLGPGLEALGALPYGTVLPEGQGQRRALHLHLQGDQQPEDDMESLAGDLGEGYRRPHSEPLDQTDQEGHRQVSCLSLPVVSLQLPTLEEQLMQQRGAAAGSRRPRRTARRPLEGFRRIRAPPGARRNHRDPHKPKLVTVAEVHKRAREERRRQREMLAAAREMAATQRLRTYGEVDAWREEARQLQQEQEQGHSLHPDSYVPAVCDAPFAVDGTTLTPRARSKMKRKGDQRRSLSPSVSDLSGVRAGVRSCLEELTRARSAAGGGQGGPPGPGGLAHTASIVHQLHHLRRQLHRLRVNCVL